MKPVSLEINNNIGIVTVNNPPVNALTMEMYRDFSAIFKSINCMDEIRVVIIRAEGKHFIVGNDAQITKEFTKANLIENRDAIKACIGAVYECRVPVISAINGAAIGAGLAIATAGDIIIASEKAIFGTPEVKIGVIGAASFLSLLVPPKVVSYMVLTGNPITAAEMEKYGAIRQIVAPEDLMDASLKMAAEFLENSPLVIEYWKRALRLNSDARWMEKFDTEMAFTADVLDTDDFKEAVASFFEKRKPNFTWK